MFCQVFHLPLTTYLGILCRLWGTFLADVVIQMLGTDYARILRAIYAFAQVLHCFHAFLPSAAQTLKLLETLTNTDEHVKDVKQPI